MYVRREARAGGETKLERLQDQESTLTSDRGGRDWDRALSAVDSHLLMMMNVTSYEEKQQISYKSTDMIEQSGTKQTWRN